MPETVHVDKQDLTKASVVFHNMPPLAPDVVRLRVESFAVTANNVTYAVIGDLFKYWNFFPANGDMGIVPMWGHAVVEASNHPKIAVGERVYGYLPMGSHWLWHTFGAISTALLVEFFYRVERDGLNPPTSPAT